MRTDRGAAARRAFRLLAATGLVALAAAWIAFLRPQFLGGPAAYVVVSGTSMLPAYESGDVVVVHSRAAYERGDVVSYRIPGPDPAAGTRVIHRIVGGSADAFVVQGDNRSAPDPWRPGERDIVGSAWLHVPHGGHVIMFVRSPFFLASLAAGLVAAAVLGAGVRPEPPSARP